MCFSVTTMIQPISPSIYASKGWQYFSRLTVWLFHTSSQRKQMCFVSYDRSCHTPVSGGLRGSLFWCAGKISNLTFSDVAANSWVASNKEQCSVLVPSMQRMWSPTCMAPHLQEKHRTTRREGSHFSCFYSNSNLTAFIHITCSSCKPWWRCIKSIFCYRLYKTCKSQSPSLWWV